MTMSSISKPLHLANCSEKLFEVTLAFPAIPDSKPRTNKKYSLTCLNVYRLWMEKFLLLFPLSSLEKYSPYSVPLLVEKSKFFMLNCFSSSTWSTQFSHIPFHQGNVYFLPLEALCWPLSLSYLAQSTIEASWSCSLTGCESKRRQHRKALFRPAECSD